MFEKLALLSDEIFQVICGLRLLFYATIENKESWDLSLYIDIIELQEKS